MTYDALDLERIEHVVEDRSPATGKTTLSVYTSDLNDPLGHWRRHVYVGDDRWPIIDRLLARYGPLVPTSQQNLLCGDPHRLIPWRAMNGDPTARQLELDTVYAALHEMALDYYLEATNYSTPQAMVDHYLGRARQAIRGRVEAAQEVARDESKGAMRVCERCGRLVVGVTGPADRCPACDAVLPPVPLT